LKSLIKQNPRKAKRLSLQLKKRRWGRKERSAAMRPIGELDLSYSQSIYLNPSERIILILQFTLFNQEKE